MKVLILQYSKSVMRSGKYKSNWTIKLNYKEVQYMKNYIRCTVSNHSVNKINISFDTIKSAINFATKNNWRYEIIKSHAKNIISKS